MSYPPPPYSNPPFPGGPAGPGMPQPAGGYGPSGAYMPPGGYGPPAGGYGPPAGGCGPPGYNMPPVQPGPPGPPGYMGPTPGPPPVNNPPTPFMYALPTVGDGMMVTLQGSVPPTANRFNINLTSGGGYGESVPIALHVNPRFEGTNKVVRNSFLNGTWNQEEREGGFPLSQGADFECIILFTPQAYKVAFNGQHFCEFVHRVPMTSVTHVIIEGDVTIRTLRVQPATGPPSGPPPMTGPPGGFHPPVCAPPPGVAVCPPGPRPPMVPPGPPMVPPVEQQSTPRHEYTMKVPHEQAIASGLFAGRAIHISGRPTKAKKFEINLCYHQSHKKNIAFHFNARFKEGTVVRNTKAGDTWGREDRIQPIFPFKVMEHFDVIIFVQKDKFVVHVNGQQFCEYPHRLRNLSLIQLLYIDGHIDLSNVSIQ